MECYILELAVRRVSQGGVCLTTLTITYVNRNIGDSIHPHRRWWNITQDGQSSIAMNAPLFAEKAVTLCEYFYSSRPKVYHIDLYHAIDVCNAGMFSQQFRGCE